MREDDSEQGLSDRFRLIERMIFEGRRDTGNWGWTFVLWGVVYYAAFAWDSWNHSAWAWPVTVAIGVVVTAVAGSSTAVRRPQTTFGRAVGSIWIAAGVSMFLLFAALGFSGRLTDEHLFAAVVSAMLGMANGASGLILRWKLQLGCALVWWAAALAACFGTDALSNIVFLAAIFLCQIAFGTYGMIANSHTGKRSGPVHA